MPEDEENSPPAGAACAAPGEAENPAPELVRELGEKSLTLALAESCTAGLAADLVARIPGASKVFWGSFVSYTVDAKVSMLGLDRKKIEKYGAVSGETARSMAEGALKKSGASLAGAVTGLAGPGGDGSGTPVGAVWIATAAAEGGTEARLFHCRGSRDGIRRGAASRLITQVLKRIKGIDRGN
ncbi:MAG: nicotinamide-nucleotide amidohydrolase family protein [Treponema sp.]|jgi:PncC family amidohydrolase|nr:nicotinamide-nucleotide amidohydrolase family protein [Treponema sp.]